MLSKSSLLKLITDPGFIDSIIEKLLGAYKEDPLVKMPRVNFKKSNNLIVNANGRDVSTFYKRDTLLTGGCVAAVILEKLYGTPAVINDVDLFYYQLGGTKGSDAYQAVYENIVDTDFHYKLRKTTEKGKLNLVRFDPDLDFTWMDILRSFDLNYTKVGIILEEKKILFNEEFIEFLLTKEIKISSDFDMDYPFTTYIRAQQKSQEYKASFYLGDTFRDYFELMKDDFFVEGKTDFIVTHKRESNLDNAVMITKKRWDYWKKNPSMFSPWVEIVKNNKIKFQVPNEPWLNFCKFLYSYKFTVPDLLAKLDTYGFKKETEATLNRLQRFLESDICHLTSHYYGGASLIHLLDKKGVAFFKSDFSQSKLDQVSNFLKNHSELKNKVSWLINNLDYSINDVIEFMLVVKKQSLQEVGEFESMNAPDAILRVSPVQVRNDNLIKALKNKDARGFFELLKSYRLEDAEKDVLIKSLPIHPFKNLIYELTTRSALLKEGESLRHCVGGYSSVVKSGRSRIFHLKIGKCSTTLEVKVERAQRKVLKPNTKLPEKASPEILKIREERLRRQSFRYSISQHKALLNREPEAISRKLAEMLIRYLNSYNS